MADHSTPSTKRILVFNFRNSTEFPSIGGQLSDMVRVLIPELKGFQVIDDGIVRDKAAESGINLDQVTDSGTGAKVARQFDAEYFIVGDIGRLGDVFTTNIKVVSTLGSNIIKAEGLEFENLVEVRKIVRGLLMNILSQGQVSGKPIISETELNHLAKNPAVSLSYAIASVIIQAAVFGLALAFPIQWDNRHLLASIALMIPPLTVLYTRDWNLAPYTIGFSVSAGIFNFIGRLLWDLSAGDWVRIMFGILLVVVGAGAKIYSVVIDVLKSTASTKRFNEELQKEYYVT